MDDRFAQEVLRLAQGQTIECYDDQIKQQAQQFGITPPAAKSSDNSKPKSTSTFVSQKRRSISVESRASQSTGLTSNFSRTSKEHDVAPVHTSRADKRKSSTAVSIKDYDSILSHAKHDNRRLSLSFSPVVSPMVTPSPSTFSLSLSSSRESSPRRHIIRSLSRLRLHRRNGSSSSVKNDDDCQFCPHDSSRHRRPSHTLSCGHKYCTPALRRVIQTAMNDPNEAPPTCCRRPIPGFLVERVTSQEEQDRLMDKMLSWDNDALSEESTNVTSTDLATVREDERKSRSSRQSLTEVLEGIDAKEAMQNLERAMTFPHFNLMRQEQEGQRDRCIQLDGDKRAALAEEYDVKKESMMRSHEQQEKELAEKQSANISQVEDKHVRDEMDLRAMQANEIRSTATALRHMEAYCRGQSTSGEVHHRTISEQDRGELAKTRHRAHQMERKHEGEISVLRGEQARRMSQRMHRQEVEVQQLETRQKRELENVREEYDSAVEEWEDEVEIMKQRLSGWWQMQIEIWRKVLEQETGIFFAGALPPVRWPGEEGEENEEPQDQIGLYPKERPAREGTGRSRDGSSPKPPPPTLGKEMGISTTFAVRSSVVGQA